MAPVVCGSCSSLRAPARRSPSARHRGAISIAQRKQLLASPRLQADAPTITSTGGDLPALPTPLVILRKRPYSSQTCGGWIGRDTDDTYRALVPELARAGVHTRS